MNSQCLCSAYERRNDVLLLVLKVKKKKKEKVGLIMHC